MTTEFQSDKLTDWAIMPRFQLAFTANFVHLLQLNPLFNLIFHFGCFSVSKFDLIKIFVVNHVSVAEWATSYGIQHWQILRSTYRKVGWVESESMTTDFHSNALRESATRPWVQLALRNNFLQLLEFHRLFSATFHFSCLHSSVVTFILSKFLVSNHMSVGEWTDTYSIHHWKILWSSFRRLISVRFEATATEFRSDALTNWTIRWWVQLPFNANFVQLLQFHRLFSVTFPFSCLPSSVVMFTLIELFFR